jgi:hypothetical protein
MDATAGAKRIGRWMFVSGVTLASLVALSGCDEPAAQAAKEEAAPLAEQAAPSPVGPELAEKQAPAAAAASSFDEEAFSLILTPPESVAVGKEVTFKIVLEAKGGYKVNEEYPIKFTFVEVKDVVPKKATLKKDDAKVEKERAEIPFTVTIKSPGKHDVAGKLSFSVCTEERCLIEKRDLKVSVNVS